MAIKKRTPVDAETEAAIAAFGAAADQPSPAPNAPAQAPRKTSPQPTTGVVRKRRPEPASPAAGEWPAGLARQLLIRYDDANLPALLAEVSTLEDRTMHKTALRALRRGLEAMRNEH